MRSQTKITSLKAYTDETWVIAVSGGPDSMALLDMAFTQKVHCIAVHINYHKRESADRDMTIVTNFCTQNKIPVLIFDALNGTGNFQDYARRFRYEKFKAVVEKHKAKGVLVAHHLNDDAETYVMQKMRNSQVTHYGLSESTMIFGVRVDRPLLKLTKQALMEYCENQNISYGIDESNESDDYLRNKVRKQLAGSSITELLDEKETKNQQLQTFRETHASLLKKSTLSLEEFYTLPYPLYFLGHWIRQQLSVKALSEDHLEELFRQIQTSLGFKQSLQSGRFIKQYGQISVLPDPKSYTYILKDAVSLKTPFFEILTQAQDQHAFEVVEGDYPLTIRSAQPNEVYFIGEEAHKLSRWFISHKIPQEERETWPVVLNCHGEAIYIFRIKLPRRVNTHKTRLYMIK